MPMGTLHIICDIYRQGRRLYSEGGFRKVASNLPRLASGIILSLEPLIRPDMNMFGVNSVEDSYLELSVEKLRTSMYHVPNNNSLLIGELLEKYDVANDPKILEIGGNAGRHLRHLHDQGYTDLHTIELNQSGIDLYRSEHPEAARETTIYHGRAQSRIQELPDDGFDVVYSNAVLQHIPNLDNLLSEISRITRGIIILIEIETVEDNLESIPGLIFRNFHRLFSHPYHEVIIANGFEEELYVPGRAPERSTSFEQI